MHDESRLGHLKRLKNQVYLLSEPCLLKPVPICEDTGNGVGVASALPSAELTGIKGLEDKWPRKKYFKLDRDRNSKILVRLKID